MKNKSVIIKSFGTVNQIEIQDKVIPEPEFGKVLVQIEASTLTSTDLTIRKGLYPLLKTPPPFTLGYDFVGRIIKLGKNVDKFEIGDRVAGISQIGGHGKFICFNENELLQINSHLDSEVIAPLVLSGMTAYQMFKYCAKVKTGDKFLVHGGSGSVGNILLQICKANGITTVATASRRKTDFIKENGGLALDYTSPSYSNNLKRIVNGGFDAALDFTNQESINRSFRLLKKGGRMILAGLLSTQKKMDEKTFWNFLKFGLEFGGMMIKKSIWNTFTSKKVYFFGIIDSRKDYPERYQNDFNELINMVEKGQIIIHKKVYALENARQAHIDLETGKTMGNIVFTNKN